MRFINVKNIRNQALIADQCSVAECFFDRLRGLIGRASMKPGEALWIPRCGSVHMWFMRFPIDVVFLDGKRRVVTSVHSDVKPWRALPLSDWRASSVLELSAGTIERCGILPGDELCLS